MIKRAVAKSAPLKAAPAVPVGDVLEVFDDIEQGTPQWFDLRLGIPTASNFGKVLAQGEGKVRSKLLRQLAGERLTGRPAEAYRNAAMDRGNAMEQGIRDGFEFSEAVAVRQIGFVRRTIARGEFPPLIIGCSPDSLLGDDGVLEIKSMIPDLMIELRESGKPFPPEHMAQCQGALWVTGRKRGVLVIGYEGMPYSLKYPFTRNDAYLADLARAVETFDYELRRLVERELAFGGR